MRRSQLLPQLVLLALTCAAPLAAQQPVTLDVSVTSGSGSKLQSVTGLQQSDFIVLDNQRPQTITSFSVGPSPAAPAEVLVVVDAVNAPFSIVANERQQIGKFLRQNGGKLPLPTSIAVLSDSGFQIATQGGHELTSHDGNALATQLDSQDIGLRSIRRSAGFYGAEERFDLSLRALRQLTEQQATRPGRKLVLWVSPGWPALSGPGVQLSGKQQAGIFSSIVDVSNRLRAAQITLFSIDPVGAGESLVRSNYFESFLKGIDNPSQVDLGDLSLQVLAIQSGGFAMHGSNDIAAQLAQAVAQNTTFYRLTFVPPVERPSEYHRLEVKVERPGLAVHARTGYYAPAAAQGEK